MDKKEIKKVSVLKRKTEIALTKFNEDADRFSIKSADILGADIIINHKNFEK